MQGNKTPRLTIVAEGWHDIYRLQANLLTAQTEFSYGARKTFRWMFKAIGRDSFVAFDRSMNRGEISRRVFGIEVE